ncbi:UDP-glucose 6-dehydrogenase tuaD [Chlamydia abortus]|uniref:Nucleotide sugar dehydrogenase n=1 Tax=Paenibacillus residui TaxID=629724 RepID=A0ABW3D9U1_9BACL|nr:nucleotide sugar dehydrogenase [Paenibacillus sp. 32O-W]SHE13377.1 UDP-glucose 6-dehydrogenase tuaD [Chlamydia abortus]
MDRTIGVVGLGYVGLPVAVAFGESYPTIGFDINEGRIAALQSHNDYTGEVSSEELKNSKIQFTADETKLRECDFIIVAVPTPIDDSKQPDFRPLISASELVGRNMQPNTIVVYESTVYPGATEEICIPVLEKHSGLTAGKDFYVGYSPERINPGDKEHTFKKITKVVSGQNEEASNIIADVYGSVVEAGVFKASTIKVAEAAKVIENTQRDLNIALMNELSIIFDRLGINTSEVLQAAGTKWNFLKFTPGLVGGHCIGVDPYYLTHKADAVGYHPQVILAGRRINDGMGQFIATSLVKQMILKGNPIQGSRVTVLGLTFKENVPDLRNSKVIDIIRELQQFGVDVQVSDARAEAEDAYRIYGIELVPFEQLRKANAVILAVPHQEYKDLGWDGLKKCLYGESGVFVDVKSALDASQAPAHISYWNL